MYWTMKTIGSVVVIAALSFSHYFVYNKGREAVHALWNEDKLVMAKAQAEAAAQSLVQLQALNAEKQKVDIEYAKQKRKAAVAASSAQHELDRLRDQLASDSTSSTTADLGASTSTGVNGRAGLEQELLGHCAATLVSMAAEADRLETVIVGLQGYVKNVCLAK